LRLGRNSVPRTTRGRGVLGSPWAVPPIMRGMFESPEPADPHAKEPCLGNDPAKGPRKIDSREPADPPALVARIFFFGTRKKKKKTAATMRGPGHGRKVARFKVPTGRSGVGRRDLMMKTRFRGKPRGESYKIGPVVSRGAPVPAGALGRGFPAPRAVSWARRRRRGTGVFAALVFPGHGPDGSLGRPSCRTNLLGRTPLGRVRRGDGLPGPTFPGPLSLVQEGPLAFDPADPCGEPGLAPVGCFRRRPVPVELGKTRGPGLKPVRRASQGPTPREKRGREPERSRGGAPRPSDEATGAEAWGPGAASSEEDRNRLPPKSASRAFRWVPFWLAWDGTDPNEGGPARPKTVPRGQLRAFPPIRGARELLPGPGKRPSGGRPGTPFRGFSAPPGPPGALLWAP